MKILEPLLIIANANIYKVIIHIVLEKDIIILKKIFWEKI